MSISNNKATGTADIISFGNQGPLSVDGRLLQAGEDYMLVDGGGRAHLLTRLKKEDALKKYGISAEKGMLEISTL